MFTTVVLALSALAILAVLTEALLGSVVAAIVDRRDEVARHARLASHRHTGGAHWEQG